MSATLDRDLQELAGLSQAAGKRVDWAQGAGGNTSIKSEGLLLVKASGLRLNECTAQRGFVGLDLAAVRAELDSAAYLNLAHAAQQDAAGDALVKALQPLPGVQTEGLRPSLEAEFHALGPRVCLHVHLVEALAALCLVEAQEAVAAALEPVGQAWAWADYRPPGHSLACLVRDALRSGPAELAFMGNHGVVAWGDSAAQAIARVEKVQKAFAAYFKAVEPAHLPAKANDKSASIAAARRAAHEAWPHLGERMEAADPWAQSIAAGGAWGWQPVCPDDVIYCGLQVPVLSAGDAADAAALQRRLGEAPPVAVLAIEGRGVVIAAKDARAAQAAHELLQANARARALGRSRGHIRPLSPEQGRELLGMKGEQHRQKL